MRGLIIFSLRNPVLTAFLTILVAIAGAVAYYYTPIEAYPDVTSTRARIITQWSGRSAEEVEKFISLPISRALANIPRKREIRSISLFGLSVVTVLFDDDVDDFYAQQSVATRLPGIALPAGAEPYLEPPYGATGEIFRYIVRGDLPLRELTALQDWVIEKNLLQVPGVADIVSFGGEEKIYEVQLDLSKLEAYNLTALDVFEAIARSNINVGGDIIERGEQAYVVRGVGLLESLQDIENLIITVRKKVPILVKQVAQVRVASKPRLGQCGYQDLPDVVQGIVLMRRGEDPSAVIPRIKAKIHELNTRILPPGVTIEPFLDRTELVNTTVQTVLHNLIEGVLLVSLVVGLFLLEWRAVLIVVSVIPLAFLFAILGLRLQGLPANLISMGALDFGLLLEGTLVIVENALVSLAALSEKNHFNPALRFRVVSGLLKRVALRNGRYIFFAQLILLLALMPIFLFERVEGKLFKPLAYTLGYAMLGALILSLTYVPAMMRLLLRLPVRERELPFLRRFLQLWEVLPVIGFRYHRVVALCLLGMLVGAGIGFYFYGSEFVPKLNEGAIYIRGTFPISIRLGETVRTAQEVKDWIRQLPEVRFVLFQAGRPNDGTDPTGFFNLELHVQLHPPETWRPGLTREKLVDAIRKVLTERYEGVRWAFSQPIQDNVEEYVSGVKSSIVVKVFGQNLEELEAIAYQIGEFLQKEPGIADVVVFQSMGLPELRIKLQEDRMARYGVSMREAQAVIEMAIGGQAANYYYEGERLFEIRVRLSKAYRDDFQVIRNIRVPTMTGRTIPLYAIADIQEVTGPAFIYREGTERYVAVGFSVTSRDLGGTIARAQEAVEAAVKLPPGTSLSWVGEFESKERATRRLSIVVPAVLVLILFLLYFQFGTMHEVVVAAAVLPLAFVGGFTSWVVSGTPFGVSAGVGLIILFGVSTINALILIGELRGEQTLSHRIEAVRRRIRPLVVVMLIGALGLLPAAISHRMGSEVQKPLAITIVGGLPITLVLSLLGLPAFYRLLMRLKK
jgi:cobalt-zinc-cadmium resistance protein CzcA